jgi:hypothetical protein
MDDNKQSSGRKQHTVYQIIEKPGREKPVWMRLGIAHINRDHSINVYLDAIPYERKLQIREEEVKPRQPSPEPRRAPAEPTALDFGGSIQ